jgi:hypothetical protein
LGFPGLRSGFPLPRCLTGHPSGYYLLCLPLTVWPFPLYVAFPRAEYYGHADAWHGHRRIAGGLSPPSCLALLDIPCQLSHVHTHRLKRGHLGGGYLSTHSVYDGSRVGMGYRNGRPSRFRLIHAILNGDYMRMNRLGGSDDIPPHPIRTRWPFGQGFEPGVPFPVG